MKLLLYCTKAKPYLMKYDGGKYKELASFYNKKDLTTYDLLNGKIVAECDFEIEEIIKDISSVVEEWYSKELLKKACSTAFELDDYLQGKNGYAIHIKNLHIFDSPKFLEGFDDSKGYTLRKAPKNMCKVLSVKIGDYDYKDLNSEAYEPYILISIRPEWLCKILNGEKTIEVRKKVLKVLEE